jgi:hypothetical protein
MVVHNIAATATIDAAGQSAITYEGKPILAIAASQILNSSKAEAAIDHTCIHVRNSKYCVPIKSNQVVGQSTANQGVDSSKSAQACGRTVLQIQGNG